MWIWLVNQLIGRKFSPLSLQKPQQDFSSWHYHFFNQNMEILVNNRNSGYYMMNRFSVPCFTNSSHVHLKSLPKTSFAFLTITSHHDYLLSFRDGSFIFYSLLCFQKNITNINAPYKEKCINTISPFFNEGFSFHTVFVNEERLYLKLQTRRI